MCCVLREVGGDVGFVGARAAGEGEGEAEQQGDGGDGGRGVGFRTGLCRRGHRSRAARPETDECPEHNHAEQQRQHADEPEMQRAQRQPQRDDRTKRAGQTDGRLLAAFRLQDLGPLLLIGLLLQRQRFQDLWWGRDLHDLDAGDADAPLVGDYFHLQLHVGVDSLAFG